jgi:hypothetical protein
MFLRSVSSLSTNTRRYILDDIILNCLKRNIPLRIWDLFRHNQDALQQYRKDLLQVVLCNIHESMKFVTNWFVK